MKSKEAIITGAMIILVTYTLALSLVGQAFPSQQASKTLSSSGTIQIQTSAEIGVYTTSQCTTPLTSLSWGTLEPGGSQNSVCYIRNEGNTPLTLSLQSSNWNPPAAQNYLTLSWNYNGQTINPDAVIQVTLTLNVDADITGITTFSFSITIIGTS